MKRKGRKRNNTNILVPVDGWLRLRLIIKNPVTVAFILAVLYAYWLTIRNMMRGTATPGIEWDLVWITCLLAFVICLNLVASLEAYRETWRAYVLHEQRCRRTGHRTPFKASLWMRRYKKTFRKKMQPCPRLGARTAIKDCQRIFPA